LGIDEKIAKVDQDIAETQGMMSQLNEQVRQTVATLNEKVRQLAEQLVRLDERRKVYTEAKREAEKKNDMAL